jgi:hypothetical protein
MSDSVLYPRPAGTSEALRQDVARSRQELAETIEALAARLSVRAVARRNAVAAVPLLTAVTAGTAVYALSPRSRLTRVVLAVAASGLAYLAADWIPRYRRSVSHPAPASVALPPSPEGGDVVDLLIDQHREVQRLFEQLAAVDDGTVRRELFAHLVEVLTRHEMAEREIVHPAVRGSGDAGSLVADERVHEEAAADRAIASLISRGPDDRNFGRALADVRDLVAAHAAREEADEFPLMRALLPLAQRQRMAGQVRAAQSESW